MAADLDIELADLPAELRWREWRQRVEAVVFAAAAPVPRETLARLVGRDCSLDLLLDDLRAEIRGRPYDLVKAGGGYAFRTKARHSAALRAAFAIDPEVRKLSPLEAGVLGAIAYEQPLTRAALSEIFGREISRDLIAGLRDKALIAPGQRDFQVVKDRRQLHAAIQQPGCIDCPQLRERPVVEGYAALLVEPRGIVDAGGWSGWV